MAASDGLGQAATAILAGLGVSNPSQTQLNLVGAWIRAEKPPGAPLQWNNPLNTTLSLPGALSQNSVGVKSYPTFDQGIAANVATIKQENMTDIRNAILKGDTFGFINALHSDPWGTSPTLVAQILASPGALVGKLTAPFQTEGVSATTAATSPAVATGTAQAAGGGLPGPVPGIASVGTLVGQVLDPRNWWRLLLYLAGAALIAIGLVIYVWGGNAGSGAKRAISKLPIVPVA